MNDPQGGGRKYNTGGKIFFGNGRAEKMANNNLGITQGWNSTYKKFRSKQLDIVESYLSGTQYDHLANWQECCSTDTYTEIRKRKPSVIFPFAKILQDRVASKLVGGSTFPKLKVQDDEETTYFLSIVKKAVFLEPKMLDVAKNFISYTSCFARFRLVMGSPKIDVYQSNYCYPVFDEVGELQSIEIKYIYETSEIDKSTGKKICKWYKLELSKNVDTLYDNPIYEENSEPEFQVVEQTEHNLGFVQGEWFRYGENTYDVDGFDEPLIYQLRGFIDAINYNLSQSDSATSYGLDPQLILKKIEEEDIDSLIKSSSKAWALGREGEASLLETNGSGVKTAHEMESILMKRATDSARIVFLDPEKMASSAQSGKAMEVMHGPLVELVNELRPWFEKSLIAFVQKIVITLVYYNNVGAELAITMPPKWTPQSLDIEATWPPIFEKTTQDIQQIVSIAIQASNANIIARDTAGKWIQSQGIDFGVEDWDLETQKINGQQRFGGFF